MSTTPKISSSAKELPRMASASSCSPFPRWMEHRGAPPMPQRFAKPIRIEMMGRHRPRPVREKPPLPRNPPDVHAVYNIVQDVDELSRCHGESQAQDVARDAPLGKITFGLLRLNLLHFWRFAT